MTTPAAADSIEMSPRDILSGLGTADRDTLALCLALFDASAFTARLAALYAGAQGMVQRLGGRDVEESVPAIRARIDHWVRSEHTDEDLRVLLWIYLREAFCLPPKLSISRKGAGQLADDLAAALIHALDPPSLIDSSKRWLTEKGWFPEGRPALTLADVVLPVMHELVESAMDSKEGADPALRGEVLRRAVGALNSLRDQDKEALLGKTGADDLNDTALRNMLLTGGGLTAASASVGLAGFSAYILAAKASAVIPFVSGPGLVSFVAVLTNPVTVAGGTAAAVWAFGRSAQRRVNVAIGARVIAMLTIQGMHSGEEGLDAALRSFPRAAALSSSTELEDDVIDAYRQEWELIAPLAAGRTSPEPSLRREMARPLLDSRAAGASRRPRAEEKENSVAFATLTLGDIVYSAAAIDPAVLQAADFSRVAEIDGPYDFAQLARQILDADSAAAVTGGVSQLTGYTAEQVVAAQLAAAGHTVGFPEASNQPGWDLLVDGQPVQVKFHESIGGLQAHVEKYGLEYPVIVNSELADKIPPEWADKVFCIDGVSHELVEQITEDSLAAGVDMMNPAIVPFALIVSGARAGIAYRAGRVSPAQAVEQLLLDGSVRMGLAFAGKWVGAGVGFSVFGPAGAWVFGAGLPVLAQSQSGQAVRRIREHLRTSEQQHWAAACHDALDDLVSALSETLAAQREQLMDRYGTIENNLAGEYVRWRLQDEITFTVECQARCKWLDRERLADPEQRMTALLRWLAASELHPSAYQSKLRQASDRLAAKPGYMDSRAGRQVSDVTNSVLEKGRDWSSKVRRAVSERVSRMSGKAKRDVPGGEA